MPLKKKTLKDNFKFAASDLNTFEYEGEIDEQQIRDYLRQGYDVTVDDRTYTLDKDGSVIQQAATLPEVTVTDKRPVKKETNKENKKALAETNFIQNYLDNVMNQWLRENQSPVAGYYPGGGTAKKKVFDDKTNQILFVDPNNLQVFNIKGEQLDWQDFEDRAWNKKEAPPTTTWEKDKATKKKVFDDKTNQILFVDPNNLQVFNIKGEQLDWQDFEDRAWNKKEAPPTTTWEKDKATKKTSKIKPFSTLNYKEWNLTDYSDYSSFNSAFRNAKENNEPEFMYKGKRYNTQLIPKEQSDLYHESKKFLEDYYTQQVYKPVDISDYGLRTKFLKEKVGFDWMEYYNEIKDKPEYTDVDYYTGKNVAEYEKIQANLDRYSALNKSLNSNKEFFDYAMKEGKIQDIKNLKEPYYFSITSQKPANMPEDGYVDPSKKKIFLTTNSEKGKLNTTYIHELSHKGDSWDVMDRVPPINTKLPQKKNYKSTGPHDPRKSAYLTMPTEIEARKLSTLFYLYKNNRPYTNITKEDLDLLYKEMDANKLPYDIEQLLDLYSLQQEDLLKYLNNDFKYNNKALGGSVHQYPGGGEVKKNSTKYEVAIDEPKQSPKNEPPDWYTKIIHYLPYLAGETALDQIPGKVGDAYKIGKVTNEATNGGFPSPLLESLKIPGPWFIDAIINAVQDNPYYNMKDIDKKIFGSPKPHGMVDSVPTNKQLSIKWQK